VYQIVVVSVYMIASHQPLLLLTICGGMRPEPKHRPDGGTQRRTATGRHAGAGAGRVPARGPPWSPGTPIDGPRWSPMVPSGPQRSPVVPSTSQGYTCVHVPSW
jgi:hypothetical protein